ncbi:MAG: hypothetical protein IPJ28_15060 [Betaproteobacteria bacterium]|nr:hypothetical protein [Betaproteobacteria bacterium]
MTSEKRSALLPDADRGRGGIARLQGGDLVRHLAPAGTPDVVARLNRELAKALASPDLTEHLRMEGGSEPTGGSPEQFRAFLKEDIERWAAVVRPSGAKAN